MPNLFRVGQCLFPEASSPRLLCSSPSAQFGGAEMKLTSPQDYQVIQRSQASKGVIPIVGELTGATPPAQPSRPGFRQDKAGDWESLAPQRDGARFTLNRQRQQVGGIGSKSLRATAAGKEVAHRRADHVGIGEIFIVAGQSNSANYVEEKQTKAQNGRGRCF